MKTDSSITRDLSCQEFVIFIDKMDGDIYLGIEEACGAIRYAFVTGAEKVIMKTWKTKQTQHFPSDDDIRKAVGADIQQWLTQILTPERAYPIPIDNVKALLKRVPCLSD